jgi:hypothetical protein
MRHCTVPLCQNKHYGQGLCSLHYQQRLRERRGVPKRITDTRLRIEADSIPVTESGCWLWLGTVNHRGYGCISVNDKTHTAHRLAWEAWQGPIAAGAYVLHKCDVRCCVNPRHLFLGDHAENMADMTRKGRSLYGEKNTMSKLDDKTVLLIRSSTESSRVMAQKLGVSKSLVKQVRARTIWKHV